MKRVEGFSTEVGQSNVKLLFLELAIQLPGLKKLCFNPAKDENAIYDGVAELWFDSEESFIYAYQTDLGKAVAEDSLAHVDRRDRLFVDENELLKL